MVESAATMTQEGLWEPVLEHSVSTLLPAVRVPAAHIRLVPTTELDDSASSLETVAVEDQGSPVTVSSSTNRELGLVRDELSRACSVLDAIVAAELFAPNVRQYIVQLREATAQLGADGPDWSMYAARLAWSRYLLLRNEPDYKNWLLLAAALCPDSELLRIPKRFWTVSEPTPDEQIDLSEYAYIAAILGE